MISSDEVMLAGNATMYARPMLEEGQCGEKHADGELCQQSRGGFAKRLRT